MGLKLYLVRGNDVEGENQDSFIVAGDPDEAIRLWNSWCIDNEFPREWNDGFSRRKVVQPENVREILDDITRTKHDTGQAHYVEWSDVPVVS